MSSTIRRVLSNCVVCWQLHGVVGQQQMADLPRNRLLSDELSFSRTGENSLGPFEIKRRRVTVKRYGIIFTYWAIRADHLAVAASLTTDYFINALWWFIAQRGKVLELRSDNRTNFAGAEKELKKAIQEWNTSKIDETLLQQGIKLMFTPELPCTRRSVGAFHQICQENPQRHPENSKSGWRRPPDISVWS